MKPTAFDGRILHQGRSYLTAGHQREDSVRRTCGLERSSHNFSSPPGEAQVARVGLDDHGAANCQGRGGVTAGDREGEREVRRREHGHRPNGLQDAAQVGRGWSGLRVRVVDHCLEVGAFGDHAGEQAKLPGGPGYFPGEAGGAQAGLGIGDLHQLGSVGV
ncbi:hypothetical protein RKD54_000539 [Pseudarthrobacter sp. SLBN-100]